MVQKTEANVLQFMTRLRFSEDHAKCNLSKGNARTANMFLHMCMAAQSSLLYLTRAGGRQLFRTPARRHCAA